ncbi:nicotinate-nucleotide adenylyltransferase [Yoonia maritima]|uniref:nicotinate-nucleotide adenylyltransferase n=1 Tax=Yoonia maritima TaxID=1435347 RepID=UPI001EF9179A|nr:nicotinate-nucleotide adenylyltransferase [Yoonia maritima]
MYGFPVAKSGQVIGLLGGSFDPPHEGHVHITKAALKRFGLDHVWWLVSPGNPLKKNGPAPLNERIQAASAMMQHPRVRVTGVEAQLGTRYTAQTLQALQRRYPGVRFVWLMGADNLAQFHYWQDWRWIIDNVPIGVIARPGDRIAARLSKAGRMYAQSKVPSTASHIIGRLPAPAWSFVNLPMSNQSSTAIRARGEWK